MTIYKLIKDNITNTATAVQRLSDNACIPFDPDNTDYQAFLKYQADGGRVYGADEEVPDGQTS